MEAWEILFICAGIIAMLVLISVALNFFSVKLKPEKIEGNKEYVLSSLSRSIFKCLEENEGRKESIICDELILDSKENISSSDILNSLEHVDPSRVRAEDLGSHAKIIIRYENQTTYVEKVEHERIST